MRTHRLELFADYFQFYLQDEDAEGDLSNSWNDEAFACLLALAPGTVGVGTVRNVDVQVSVEVLEAEPSFDLRQWDMVNECELQVASGRIVIAGCTEYFPDAQRIEVTPGTYATRILYRGLGSVGRDGLEGEDEYHVQLWQAAEWPTRTLKLWGGVPKEK